MSNKRNYFFDYLRVLSVLLVITSHYAYMFDSSETLILPREFLTGGIGRLGVSFFFMISGGMAYLSLQKYATKDYYVRRVISILLPYNVVYFFMAVLLLAMGGVLHVDYPRNTLGMILSGERALWEWLPSLLGFDHYLHGIYDMDTLYFTGEWFIGCIIILYFLAPLLFKLLNYPSFLTLAFALIISVTSYNDSALNPYWSASVRLSDFVFGMIFIKHYAYFEKYKLQQIACSGVCILMGGGYALSMSLDFRQVLFPLSPQSLIFSVSFFMLVFGGYRYSNFLEDAKLQKGIRALASRAYIIMLLQHVVIIAISVNADMSKFNGAQAFTYYIVVLFTCERLSFIVKVVTSWCERKIMKSFSKCAIN
ncbi:acyltransferase [Hafnia alvei]|uniref:Acyltransferase n=2 Tax=Hafnia alvei TaxID=569 RepID=A0ABD7PYN8_HAFAL|nr:acyltransferase [Hafnia alvei]